MIIWQFPTPFMPEKERDKIIQEACTIAAEEDEAITRMAQTLADKVTAMGVKSALRLLAAIGLAAMERKGEQ